MTEKELNELWMKINRIIHSPTKAAVKPLVDSLLFYAEVQYIDQPEAREKLKSVIRNAYSMSESRAEFVRRKFEIERAWAVFRILILKSIRNGQVDI